MASSERKVWGAGAAENEAPTQPREGSDCKLLVELLQINSWQMRCSAWMDGLMICLFQSFSDGDIPGRDVGTSRQAAWPQWSFGETWSEEVQSSGISSRSSKFKWISWTRAEVNIRRNICWETWAVFLVLVGWFVDCNHFFHLNPFVLLCDSFRSPHGQRRLSGPPHRDTDPFAALETSRPAQAGACLERLNDR